ncbi:hypothetical protein P3T76_012240 [Phytophthora citrophthora]|uniref:RxLR effector protein n=1 Tax=Phytophthora citrophthora TaxID=4793 RepID=A0AAD9G5K7_9STRA|nr:hypothetical protein P3T76_012240 [Phytophthora citrophthora]
MRFSLCLLLLVAFTVVCTDATRVGSTPDSKKMEVKKALNRLRRVHKEERIVPPVAAYYYALHSTPSASTQSSQILHAVEDNTPLPKAAKAVIAVVSVGLITGAIIGTVMLTKMLNKAILSTGSDAS